MKTRKIYEKPMCEVVGPGTEELCFNVHGSETGLPSMGAKQNQFIIDDSGDESQGSEIQ